MHCISWDVYLNPANVSVSEHKQRSVAAFAGQKQNIKKLFSIVRPKTIVCMGAGYLNDIPVDDFVAGDTDIYFAEWMRLVTEQSFQHDVVQRVKEDFSCIACECSGSPQKYCKNYKEWKTITKNIDYCGNFKPAAENVIPLCANFAAGEFPQFIHADVTSGIAEQFISNVHDILSRSKKPRQAFQLAIHKSEPTNSNKPLPIKDHTIDFITSSMVVSQFDFEPYSYFIRNVLWNFDKESIDKDISHLNLLEKTLRNNLFMAQVEGHCQEIIRLLKPKGRVYFSMETMHHEKPSAPWFQVEIAPKAMEIIGKYFYFDMESLPEILTAERVAMIEGGESIIQAHILVPK